MKEKLKKAIPELPDAPLQTSTDTRNSRAFKKKDSYTSAIQEFRNKNGIDTTNKDNTVAEIQINGNKLLVLKENVFAKARLLDFGLLHGILVNAKASGVIVLGATEQQFKGTKEYNAAHTVGVGLKLGLF